MKTTEEIVRFAQEKKSSIIKLFYGRTAQKEKKWKGYQLHELNALLLLTLSTPADLCIFLNETLADLEDMINHPAYDHFTINKKNGGYRQIYAPITNLKAVQKRLNYFLQAYYLWIKPIEVHGFVVHPNYLSKYCNIVENAKAHTGKKHVLNIDLKNFFPSITARQVKRLFVSPCFGFNEQMANALTLLTTYESRLPIGAPTSPVISNFICQQLDRDLISFCEENYMSYTRYADDLTFSSHAEITADNILDIVNLIQKNNFKINEKKLRLKDCNRRQIVTGLTVNEKVNIDRKLLKNIRAMLHDYRINGLQMATRRHFKTVQVSSDDETLFLQRLEGYINFVGQVRGKDDTLYLKYKTEFAQAFEGKKS